LRGVERRSNNDNQCLDYDVDDMGGCDLFRRQVFYQSDPTSTQSKTFSKRSLSFKPRLSFALTFEHNLI